MLELASERPFDDVTVRELAERADVGYATFFRHYASKEALLLDVLGGIVGELADLVQPIADEGRYEDAGRRLFEYVAENANRMKVLLSARHGSAVERELHDVIRARVLASDTFRPPSGVPAEVAAHHLAASSLAMVTWWLDRGRPHGPEVMGSIYARLVVRPTREEAGTS
jgi:AcrR family transcriptional regulator